MRDLFTKSFFKFALGFLALIFIGILIVFITGGFIEGELAESPEDCTFFTC